METLAQRLHSILKGSDAFTLLISFDRVEWFEAWLYDVLDDALKVSWEASAKEYDIEYLPLDLVKSIRVIFI